MLARLTPAYRAAADPQRAAGMAAYMRHQFPFLGIPRPERTRLDRQVLAAQPRPAQGDLELVARACWDLPEREFQYFAVRYLRRHVAVAGPSFLTGTVADLLTRRSWWDTADELATRVVGPLVANHPQLQATMRDWIDEPRLWLARTAVLHQLHYGPRTDADLLFRFCLQRGHDPEWFLRKAAGWALRQYARTDPEAVRAFCAANEHRLSTLCLREARKHL